MTIDRRDKAWIEDTIDEKLGLLFWALYVHGFLPLGVQMSELSDALDAQSASITNEFSELAAKIDALEEANNDPALEAQIADLQQQISDATSRVQANTAEIGNLSTAGDDAPPA